MIETLVTSEAQELLYQLNSLLEQEIKCQPKACGLRLIETSHDNGLRMTARLRDFEVQPKHLGCIGLTCFYLAVKAIEEERNVPLATDLIRISQYKFSVFDMMRMEKIVLEKLGWKVKATTALHFLQLYHSLVYENLTTERKKLFVFERLESHLKACHCRIGFSKAKPSVLALSIMALEMQEQKLFELNDAIECLQKHSKIGSRDILCWKEMVSKCLAEYSSSKCSRPNVQKLKWIVSGRTARQLKHSYYRIAHLPTIPESAS
ncbi:cyclin-G1 isoform X2 [Bombina bombina]|uniref:cyclin-G1 isoform X2 n=1 Tax=Bombina bombina TaxID=8345 RepID=UPI00235B2A28|nr:cyclin-G1 isoform X2 [Bombina bombina]